MAEPDKVGCNAHTFIPQLLEPRLRLIATDANANAYYSAHGAFIKNSGNDMTSVELREKMLDGEF